MKGLVTLEGGGRSLKLLYPIFAILLLFTFIQSVTASCSKDVVDRCQEGFYESRPEKGVMTCVVCFEDTPPVERIIDAPVFGLGSSPHLRTIEIPQSPPNKDECAIQYTTTDLISCFKRKIWPNQGKQLSTCQEVDSIISAVENADYLKTDRFGGDISSVPSWLRDDAIEIEPHCQDMIESFSIIRITHKQERGCRGNMIINVLTTVSNIKLKVVRNSSPDFCDRSLIDISNEVSLRNGIDAKSVTIRDEFVMRLRLPKLGELEGVHSPITEQLTRQQPNQTPPYSLNIQCSHQMGNLVNGTDVTIFLGSNCEGGSVSTNYRLRIENKQPLVDQDLFPQCIDKRAVVRYWETYHPITGEICNGQSGLIDDSESSTVSVDIRIFNDQGPKFIDSIDLPIDKEKYKYVLGSRSEIDDFQMKFQGACDHPDSYRNASKDYVSFGTASNVNIACTDEVQEVDITFIGQDDCGNEIRHSRPFLLHGTKPALPTTPLVSKIKKTCRRHIPPPSTIIANDNRMGRGVEGSDLLSFEMIDQVFTIDRQHIDKSEQLDENGESVDICDNKLQLKRVYKLKASGCAHPVNYTEEFDVDDNEGPVYINSTIPEKYNRIECMEQLPSFEKGSPETFMKARDDCDQVDIIVEGTRRRILERERSVRSKNYNECPDRGIILDIWTATDYCGNNNTFIRETHVNDKTAPELVPNTDIAARFCMDSKEQGGAKFVCFPNIRQKIANYFVLSDNCNRDVFIDIVNMTMFTCTNGNDISTCTDKVVDGRIAGSTESRIWQHYYEHNDTLCLNRRHSTYHTVEFDISDMCDNHAYFTWSLFTSSVKYEDSAYNPNKQETKKHSCDGRHYLQSPSGIYNSQDTVFGDIYIANRIDTTIRADAAANFGTVATSGAKRTRPNPLSLW